VSKLKNSLTSKENNDFIFRRARLDQVVLLETRANLCASWRLANDSISGLFESGFLEYLRICRHTPRQPTRLIKGDFGTEYLASLRCISIYGLTMSYVVHVNQASLANFFFFFSFIYFGIIVNEVFKFYFL